MKKSIIKACSVLLIVILSVSILTTIARADDVSFGNVDSDYVTRNAHDSTGTATAIQKILGAALTVAQVIGVGVAVIMLIVLAIKYISAAPSDKAEIKTHAVVYVVGAIVLFAASGILQVIKNAAGIINDSTTNTAN